MASKEPRESRGPSARALAFKAWMTAVGTNTRQVHLASGVAYSTLASFVQGGTQRLIGENEELIASAFGVPPSQIFGGAEAGLVRIIGTAGADAEGQLIQSHRDQDFDMVPPPPGGDPDAVAVWVAGDSMRAIAGDGSLLYFRDQRNPPTPDMISYNCIVELEDGRVLFKRLLRGSEPGLFMLESQSGPPINDVRIRWAAEPITIVPAKEARRIVRRAGISQIA